MTSRRSWSSIVTHYKLALFYISLVVTVALILQIWELKR